MENHYPHSKRRYNNFCLTLIVIGIFLNCNFLISQSLVVTNFDADGFGEAEAMQDCGHPVGVVSDLKNHFTVPWVQGGTTWFGVPYDYISALSYQVKLGTCGAVHGNISAHCYVGGDGTNTMVMDWNNWASVYALLEPFYYSNAQSTYWYNVTVQIMPGGSYNVGDPIVLYFQYHFSGAGITEHESFFEDPVSTVNTCELNGNSIIGNLYNFSNPPGLTGWRRATTNGVMTVAVGDTLRFDFYSVNQAEINPPGLFLFTGQRDRAQSKFRGKITLSLDPIPLPPQYSSTYDPRIEFSLDIGSDAELSDPNQNGNEVFDPGDAYLMNGPLMAAPQNGVKNDAVIFGFDPVPDPFTPGTAVPVGSGVFNPGLYFNLNGMDNMQASLFGMSYGPGAPSISYFSDSLVFLAEYLLISYDDDAPQNWAAANAVPVNSQSPLATDTYGRTAEADEVIAVDLDPYQVPSFPFTIDSLWSEANIHPNLVPNPDINEERDNDVNALNYFPNQYIDGYFYFSVSHEATFNHPIVFGALNPGSVYQLLGPGNFVEVVNPLVHLGIITPGVDLDAFSFGWVFDSIQARLGLALLFSVDMDDWNTPQNESGGLDPAMIYYSFLDGTHHEFSEIPFRDDIDAITVVPYSFNGYALPDFADYGDAPEGHLAYIVPATTGNFPTCESIGPVGSSIRHKPNPGLFFGHSVDYELSGNAGYCPFYNLYDQDECFLDGDAGLIVPRPYTITGPPGAEIIVSCSGFPEPWKTCRRAVWGASVDIHVENMLPGIAYINLLVDWDQNGEWGGNMTCPDGNVASEHAVVNFVVPAGFSGPLSQLSPPNFRIGSNEGYVWTRFTITEVPVPAVWVGSGTYNFGETEDYLIAVADPILQVDVSISNTTFGAGSDDCFEALDLIEISDSEFNTGSSFIAVAGHTVRVSPDSHFKSGAYALLKIDQDGNFCSNYKSLLNVDEAIDEQPVRVPDPNEPLFRVYPNPSTGRFALELLNPDESLIKSVGVYNIIGENILNLDLRETDIVNIDLSGYKKGVYLLRVTMNQKTEVKRIIVQ